jgi:hypothetical protein
VLTNLFDEVINELRAAAGEKQFSLDLRVGQSDFEPEPLLRPPTLRECIELALAAAMATDTADDRWRCSMPWWPQPATTRPLRICAPG